jgi:cytosine deaminase
MLVLSRQRDQAIMIGDEIQVQVVDIRGDKVRIGINAPRSVSVHRKEIYDAITNENASAGQIKADDVSSLVSAPNNPPMKLVTDPPLDDAAMMRSALDEARKSLAHNGIPIGAVLARADKIIGRGHDRRIQRGDSVALAELDAISNAGKQRTYGDTVLHTTLMPCLAGIGAILQVGIPRLVVGDSTHAAGNQRKSPTSADLILQFGIEWVDASNAECLDLMTAFLRDRPGFWGEADRESAP